MNQDKIVVVMGGPSSEASISRQTGAAVLKALQSKGCNASGMEFVPETFSADIKASGAKLVFNAMHGKFGEDGLVQAALELLGIPYTGSGVLASAVTMDKAAAKRVFLAEGISTPHSNTYQKQEMERDLAAEIRAEFSLPVVVKAATQGSSIGVVIVEQASELPAALVQRLGPRLAGFRPNRQGHGRRIARQHPLELRRDLRSRQAHSLVPLRSSRQLRVSSRSRSRAMRAFRSSSSATAAAPVR